MAPLVLGRKEVSHNRVKRGSAKGTVGTAQGRKGGGGPGEGE